MNQLYLHTYQSGEWEARIGPLFFYVGWPGKGRVEFQISWRFWRRLRLSASAHIDRLDGK